VNTQQFLHVHTEGFGRGLKASLSYTRLRLLFKTWY